MFLRSATGLREVREALADVADREVLAANLHLAALDLGQVEDVVDHRQEHPAGRLDVAGVTAVALVELVGPGEDLGKTDDRIERRAQLVAHGRQEVALEAIHLEESQVGLGQLVDLLVQVVVHLAQRLLHGNQVVKHAVERVRKLLEFVAGLDLAANREPARGDRVGNVAKVLDRLDDHVPDDDVRREHRDDRRDQCRRDQHGAVHVDRLDRLLHRQSDDDGPGQVADLRLGPSARRRPPACSV